MTPNEQRLKEAEAEMDKLDRETDAVDEAWKKAYNKLSKRESKLDEQISELRETVQWEKTEAKILAKLKAGKKGIFDKRFSRYRAIRRLPHTYWADKNGDYAARAATQKVVRFFKKDHNYNISDALYYAIHGKLRPEPKPSTAVDIGALNRALSNTGYKVVSK